MTREVTVDARRLDRWLAGFAERHGEVTTRATADEVELVGADGARAWLTVPYPPLPSGSGLPEHALARRKVGVLLVRRGGWAAGVFDGDELVASKVGSAYVQGTTKAGGWSQQRFARRRANQAGAAFAAAARDAAGVFAGRTLDAMRTGGDRPAVRSVLADPALVRLRLPEPTGAWLEVGDPRLRTLRELPERLRGVRVRLDP